MRLRQGLARIPTLFQRAPIVPIVLISMIAVPLAAQSPVSDSDSAAATVARDGEGAALRYAVRHLERGGVAPRQTCPGNVCLEFFAIFNAGFESQGSVSYGVERIGASAGAVAVDWSTSDGLATAGTDYVAASGTLRWGSGDSANKTVTVQLLDDSVGERASEAFYINLSNPTGGADLGEFSQATFSILDDDTFPPCTPDATTLCLNQGGRFQAQAEWRDFMGNVGAADAFDIGKQDSGLFYFFDEDNIEMLLKVLNACTLDPFNSFWVFFAATTNVNFTLTVIDTTAQINLYHNPLGVTAESVTDTSAFATCP